MAFLKCMGKLEMSLESEAVFAVHPFCIQPTCSSYWWSCRRECASSHSQFTIHLSSVYTIWILYESYMNLNENHSKEFITRFPHFHRSPGIFCFFFMCLWLTGRFADRLSIPDMKWSTLPQQIFQIHAKCINMAKIINDTILDHHVVIVMIRLCLKQWISLAHPQKTTQSPEVWVATCEDWKSCRDCFWQHRLPTDLKIFQKTYKISFGQ